MEAAWRSVRNLPPVGMICDLKLRDAMGEYEAHGTHFLHDDGKWYRIDPPTEIAVKISAWRPHLTTR